jgi:hypothetical protein
MAWNIIENSSVRTGEVVDLWAKSNEFHADCIGKKTGCVKN